MRPRVGKRLLYQQDPRPFQESHLSPISSWIKLLEQNPRARVVEAERFAPLS